MTRLRNSTLCRTCLQHDGNEPCPEPFGRCPECDEHPLDLNGDCPAGCLDGRDLDPVQPRPTSLDRFGQRNR